MSKREPQVNNFGERELKRAQDKFDEFDKQVKEMTLDRMNEAPLEEKEQQTKMSSQEIKKAPQNYLKPKRTFGPSADPKTGRVEMFNEKFRDQYEYDRKYVRFIAENHEIIGEPISLWTKPYPGIDAEEWVVPVNTPVWGPRYLAEQIKRKRYHRLVMQDSTQTGSDYAGTYLGAMVADTIKQRLDAHPAPDVQVSFNQRVSSF